MSSPLVSQEAATAFGSGPIFVVEQRDSDVRDTAEHSHSPGQLIGSLAGLLAVATEDGNWIVPATHAIWIPPNQQHALRSHGAYQGWSVYVAEASCEGLPLQPRTLRVSGLLLEIVHRAAAWGRPPEAQSEHRLASVLLDEIGDLPEEPLGLPAPRDPRVRKIVAALLADLADNRSLNEWATWAGLSPRTLARRFVDETGFGFSAWRQRARALRAIERLAEGNSVTTIALDLGYDNVSAFIAMFRRAIGVTPGRYDPEQRYV